MASDRDTRCIPCIWTRASPANPRQRASRFSGITVYGQSDPAENYEFNNWVYAYFLEKTLSPNPRTWPAAEAYVDLPIWPAMTEYTVAQSHGPTSYYWGYLAARPEQ